MDPVVSAVSLADICIRYGTALVKACKSYRHGDMEIRESILLIESLWLKIQRQLELLRGIWPTLDEDYQIHQNSVLQVLQGKAQAAISLIDGLIGKPEDETSVKSVMSKKGQARRAKYAVWAKDSLKSVLVDLKEWAEVFDVSWYLIIRLSNKEIDQQLQPFESGETDPLSTLKGLRNAISANTRNDVGEVKQSLFLPTDMFDDCCTEVENSEVKIGYGVESKKQYLFDELSRISTLSDMCRLGKVFQKVDPLKFGILNCRGLLKASSFDYLVFSVPKNLTQPQSLRTFVLSQRQEYPLNERFEVAKQLAKGVMFVHSAGFVHKNIRPEAIIIFRGESDSSLLAYLTGFERFRDAEGKTLYKGDDEWDRNIYRHPTRQGLHLEEEYTMQHDIYSLGVCMLEIGLGESLVLVKEGDEERRPNTSLIDFHLSVKGRRKRGFETKREMVKIAETMLPSRMGKRYTEICLTCIKCLDKDNNSFGDQSEFLDENGVLVGVRFIEKILSELLSLKI